MRVPKGLGLGLLLGLVATSWKTTTATTTTKERPQVRVRVSDLLREEQSEERESEHGEKGEPEEVVAFEWLDGKWRETTAGKLEAFKIRSKASDPDPFAVIQPGLDDEVDDVAEQEIDGLVWAEQSRACSKLESLPPARLGVYSTYLLAPLGTTSVFVVLEGALPITKVIGSEFYAVPVDMPQRKVVAEHFFNGENWVWVRHFTSSSTEVVSCFVHLGILFATTSEGKVLVRHSDENLALKWSVISDSGLVVGGTTGVPSAQPHREPVFFLNEDGELLEVSVRATDNYEMLAFWIQFEREHEGFDLEAERPAFIVDAEGLEANLMFFVSRCGNLLEGTLDYSDRKVRLRNLGHPPGLPLAHFRGVVLRSSLVLRAVSQDAVVQIVQLRSHSRRREYKWVTFETPTNPSVRPGGPLGPAWKDNAVFFVSMTGLLVKLTLNETDVLKRWSLQLVPIRFTKGSSESDYPVRFNTYVAIAAVDQHAMVLLSGKGNLASWRYLPSEDKVTWNFTDLPEVGSGQYCSSDNESPFRCVHKDG